MDLPKHPLDDFKTEQAIRILREDRDQYREQAALWTPTFDINRDVQTGDVIVIVKIRNKSKRFTISAETIKKHSNEEITEIVTEEALEIFRNLLLADLGQAFTNIKWNVETKSK
ncbi:MAG: hypothetical protein QXN55_01595 [Candidatus Nitrosotenuis sp.]